MTTKKIFYTLIVAVLLLSSCQKNIDQFVPDPGQSFGPDTTWYNTVTSTMPAATLKNKLLLEITRDSFELNSSTATITTVSGLQCVFPSGCLHNSVNQPVTGKVYLETHLLKKKGDIIRMGIPTTSNGSMLISGGEFFIRLIKDGAELQLAQNAHIYLKYNDSPVSGLMSVFNAVETSPSFFNWLPNLDSINNQVNANTINQSYEILSNRLHWINCDYFYDTSGIQRTTVTAVLPAHYTNANTVAYTVFNDMRSVIGMYGNETTRKFSTGKLPVNKQITVVIISKQGDDYYLGHEQAFTAVPSSGTTGVQQVHVTPVKTSFENIKAYLNNL